MKIRTLYRISKNGKTTVTPIKPTDEEYTETYRVIADEGMVLTDGVNEYICIDTDYPQNYIEEVDTSYAEVAL